MVPPLPTSWPTLPNLLKGRQQLNAKLSQMSPSTLGAAANFLKVQSECRFPESCPGFQEKACRGISSKGGFFQADRANESINHVISIFDVNGEIEAPGLRP
jgi:hypothetical protein